MSMAVTLSCCFCVQRTSVKERSDACGDKPSIYPHAFPSGYQNIWQEVIDADVAIELTEDDVPEKCLAKKGPRPSPYRQDDDDMTTKSTKRRSPTWGSNPQP
jgi:hypothetical protein